MFNTIDTKQLESIHGGNKLGPNGQGCTQCFPERPFPPIGGGDKIGGPISDIIRGPITAPPFNPRPIGPRRPF